MARLRRLVFASVLALAALSGPGAVAARPASRRVGFAPRLPANSSLAGPVTGSTRMRVAVALEPRDPAALRRFATAVSTPGSAAYGHYITPRQFAQRFGPTSAQIAAVEASLRAHGLAPGPVSANHLSIPVSASAARLERAFSIVFERVSLASRRTAVVNTVAPELDGSVAGLVQAVVGLSTLSAPHPLYARPHGVHPHSTAHVATGGPQPCATARAAAAGQSAYTADQIASAYGFSGLYGAGDQGRGQTVALYELEPYTPSDIATYQSCYGTHASVSSIAVDGGAGSTQGGEAALDIEQVIGLAPQANILVYEGPNSSSSAPGSGYYDTWSTLIGQDRARVVSASWGQCEALVNPSDASAESTLFEEAAAQGQTVFSATGDQGSEDCNGQSGPLGFSPSLAVDDPSSQPFVTAVGGTTLSSLGPRPTEKVWNNGGGLGGLLGTAPGAGGGGKSSFWAMPSYQSSAPSFLHVAQSGARETPDVSADADPNTGYLIYWNGSGAAGPTEPSGWQGIAGTSAAAPVWASATALINASSACDGSFVGFANPLLYKAAASAYGQDFNDITQGNNDFTGTNGGKYAAGPGFDMASGLGTPYVAALAVTLCKSATHPGSPAISGASLTGVGRARPTLRLTLSAGKAAPGLKTISIKLPSVLRFARRPERVTVTGPHRQRLGFAAEVGHGVLIIRLRDPASLLTITIRYATLTATRREAAAARRGHAGKLRITVPVTNAFGSRTTLHASVVPH
jgi:subtilase family serine protease